MQVDSSGTERSPGFQRPLQFHHHNLMETTIVYRGYIGIMEKKMETTIVYWGLAGFGVRPRVQGLGFCVQGLGLRGLGLPSEDCYADLSLRRIEPDVVMARVLEGFFFRGLRTDWFRV